MMGKFEKEEPIPVPILREFAPILLPLTPNYRSFAHIRLICSHENIIYL